MLAALNSRACLTRVAQAPFSVYTNQWHPVREVIRGKEIVYDHNITRYEFAIQAYLQKRRTKKSEVAPKVYALDGLAETRAREEGWGETFASQRLVPLRQLYDTDRLQKMRSMGAFDSQFVVSRLCEDHFKPLMDEYARKVVISGRVVPLSAQDAYERGVRGEVLRLYHVFFYGDAQTPFETSIELRYIALKQQKFFKFAQSEKTGYKCVWTYSQQKRVEWLQNFRARDLNLYDDFRPVFERLQAQQEHGEALLRINDEPLQKRIQYYLVERRYLQPVSRARFQWTAAYQLMRIQLYIGSLEFTRVLQVPADFHIEHSILNMHVWLVLDRLREIGTREAKLLSREIEMSFKKYTLDRVAKIHLKKKNDFIKDVNHFMMNNRAAFERHFHEYFRDDPYTKIDALVWSAIYFEKVHRYAEEVYLMGEYFVQNYAYVRTLPLQAFQECAINFDVFRIAFDYKTRILASSPQLAKEEFAAEFASDKKIKKYYYQYQGERDGGAAPDKAQIVPPPIADDAQLKRANPVTNKVNASIFGFFRKYQSLETYDYHSEQDERRAEDAKKQKKYVWKEDSDVE